MSLVVLNTSRCLLSNFYVGRGARARAAGAMKIAAEHGNSSAIKDRVANVIMTVPSD